MNQEGLQQLEGVSDAEGLRRAIKAMCQPFGKVQDVLLLPDRRGEGYLCFVQLDSPNAYVSMVDKLGGFSYGNSVVFKIPLRHLKN